MALKYGSKTHSRVRVDLVLEETYWVNFHVVGLPSPSTMVLKGREVAGAARIVGLMSLAQREGGSPREIVRRAHEERGLVGDVLAAPPTSRVGRLG